MELSSIPFSLHLPSSDPLAGRFELCYFFKEGMVTLFRRVQKHSTHFASCSTSTSLHSAFSFNLQEIVLSKGVC